MDTRSTLYASFLLASNQRLVSLPPPYRPTAREGIQSLSPSPSLHSPHCCCCSSDTHYTGTEQTLSWKEAYHVWQPTTGLHITSLHFTSHGGGDRGRSTWNYYHHQSRGTLDGPRRLCSCSQQENGSTTPAIATKPHTLTSKQQYSVCKTAQSRLGRPKRHSRTPSHPKPSQARPAPRRPPSHPHADRLPAARHAHARHLERLDPVRVRVASPADCSSGRRRARAQSPRPGQRKAAWAAVEGGVRRCQAHARSRG